MISVLQKFATGKKYTDSFILFRILGKTACF